MTLTLTGTATSHADTNDVSNLTITFADGAFTNETAATVSGSSKTDIAIDFADASGIAYAGSFTEAAANDGSVIGQRDGDAHRRHVHRRARGIGGTTAAGVTREQRAGGAGRGADAHQRHGR